MSTPGKIAFTADAWTAVNMDPFLGITAHWINKHWNLKEIIADFVPLEGLHLAENLYQAFLSSLEDLGCLSKV